jgi:hypothetical protein
MRVRGCKEARALSLSLSLSLLLSLPPSLTLSLSLSLSLPPSLSLPVCACAHIAKQGIFTWHAIDLRRHFSRQRSSPGQTPFAAKAPPSQRHRAMTSSIVARSLLTCRCLRYAYCLSITCNFFVCIHAEAKVHTHVPLPPSLPPSLSLSQNDASVALCAKASAEAADLWLRYMRHHTDSYKS